MSEKLKRCPFCGGEVEFIKVGYTSEGRSGYIRCKGCEDIFFKGGWNSEQNVTKKWNTRKPMEDLQRSPAG